MFYSHEVLTNRKYGVATVWLVATLGSKSSLRRITRKQMLDVDVAKACKTIVDPAAPMALRLQSNLLYGVSRVYLQQCGYVLADAQSAHNTMMLLLRSVTNHALDPDAGKAKPEQLVLQDDPSFLPEFALPPPEFLADLDVDLGVDFPHLGQSQSLTPFGSQQSSRSSGIAGYGLVLPSSTPGHSDVGGLQGDNGDQGGNDMLDIDRMLQLDEPEFTFGEDGDIIELTPGQGATVLPATPAVAGAPSMHSDAGASARVRQDHEQGQRRTAQVLGADQMDMGLPVYNDALAEVEVEPSAHEEVVETSSSVAAPMRRKKRSPKALPKDTRLELRNSELLDWNTNYLENMKKAAGQKILRGMQLQAKKNADHYVWGAGIGGLGRAPFSARGPLSQFMGDDLFQSITGTSRNIKTTPKRDRDSGIDDATQEEARGKRQKTGEQEIHHVQDEEGLFMFVDGEEVELPREAASALDDEQIFSAMPWNISASKRGSSAIPLSGRVTMMSEQGRPGSRPGSRMVSASPLLRRSTGRISDFEALQSLDSDALAEDEFAYAAPTSDPAEAEHGATRCSLRVREALSAEGENFFAFVAEAVTEKRDQATVGGQTGATEIGQVTFEELLPPRETSKMVACQGFLMLLSLGTKGMLDVQQLKAFDHVTINPTRKGNAMLAARDKDDHGNQQMDRDSPAQTPTKTIIGEDQDSVTEAGDDNGVLEPDDSHFREQMEAGHVVDTDKDDHDSLYDSH